MNYVDARENWKANDGWEFADNEAAWNYFFTAGMVASDEIHKPLAQQAADWYALYDMARKERNDAREELVRLRTLIADIKAWDVEQYMNIPHELRARMQAELTANDEAHRKDAAGGLSGGADCSAAT